MQMDELMELLRKLGTEQVQSPAASEPLLRGWRDASSVANDVKKLASVDLKGQLTETASRASSGSGSDSGDSTAATVLKTIGMVTGVGPLVTGLIKLFGSESRPSEPPPLTTYSLPEQVSVEAGLASDRSFVPLTYSQSGMARTANGRGESSAPATQIHVNVQAMDSRSFLDHSDDIARAVKDAMLRSHSLNDVVSEL